MKSCIVVSLVDGSVTIVAPSMWTRKDIKEFKSVLSTDPDSVVKVGAGETVTVSGSYTKKYVRNEEKGLKLGLGLKLAYVVAGESTNTRRRFVPVLGVCHRQLRYWLWRVL
jgi:hypothetical protein